MSDQSKQTLTDLLSRRSREDGARLAYAFLADGLMVTDRLMFADLEISARAIAGHLLQRVTPGDCVLLMYDAGLDFVSALFGCFYAGVVAVPLPALEASRMRSGSQRLEAVALDCNARLLLGNARSLSLLQTASQEPIGIDEASWMDTHELALVAQPAALPATAMDSIAYLQYTSGSTRSPRGVMISHANLIYQLGAMQKALGYGPDSVSVCWMPHFHDYGLVEAVLLPLFNGTPSYLMSPFTFLKRPAAWLEAIGRYRGTHTQAFNYAYRYCARRISPARRDGLDLRTLKSAGNGGEPIQRETIEEFYAAFASCGLRCQAMNPVFGLAEATLLVSATSALEDSISTCFDSSALARGLAFPAAKTSGNQTVVACGRPLPGSEVKIVDPETCREIPLQQIGEIWVSSPGVAVGYLGRVEESEATFRARLDGEMNGRTYLRTGDIGFLHEGQLYVSSRLKDLIILRGLNHYPQDLEWTVQRAHPLLRVDNGAAFSIGVDGEEQLCVVQEIEHTPDSDVQLSAIIAAIKDAVFNEHGVTPYDVTLIRAGSIPKTTSGKIQRLACRSAFLDGTLKAVTIEPATLAQPPADALLESSRPRADELIAWLRDYAQRHINSRLIDERRCVPPNIVLDLGNRGVFGLTAPERYGGLNLSHSDALRVYIQLAAIDTTIATLVFLHATNGTRPILHFATPQVRDKLIPLLASGRELAAFTLSEPGAGTNVGGVQTRIVSEGPGVWRIHGKKRWNGSAWAGVITVFGRLVDEAGKAHGLSAFVVRQSDPGVNIGPESLTMGVRGIMQNTVDFDGVCVTAEQILGEMGKGMSIVNDVLSHGRLATAAVSLGAAMRAAQLILRYTSRRQIETGLLLDNPQAGVSISEMLHRITIAQETLTHCAARLDAGDPIVPEIAMAAKVSATDTGAFSADLLVQLLGGRGYMENNLAPQIFRDTRMLTIGEGANEGLVAAIGRSVRMTGAVVEFLRQYRPDGDLASRLTKLSQSLDNSSTGPYSGADAELWRDAIRGRLAIAALNLAAAKSSKLKRGAQETVEWAERRFEDISLEAVGGPSPTSSALSADLIRTTVGGLGEFIGDLEPLAPDVDLELDPLLRREPPQPVAGSCHAAATQSLSQKRQELRELLSKNLKTYLKISEDIYER
jgi:acyl-CoA synthetase (AMP-forming)/AMP-acid ligase II/alkylation response protein AidB-like acyl-CoA dehydrogenase